VFSLVTADPLDIDISSYYVRGIWSKYNSSKTTTLQEGGFKVAALVLFLQ
jgi:hypothetical protein